MSQNPPQEQVPPTLGYAAPASGLDLKRVATQQRAIMLCILAEIGILVLQFATAGAGVPVLRILLGLAYLGVVLTAAVFIFMLSISLYNTGLGIVMGILVLIPLLGLIVLLMVNGKATNLLRRHGIRVGLLGADPSTIPAGVAQQPPAGPR